MVTFLSRIESCILLYCVLLHSWISALYLYSLLRGPPGDRTENGRFRDQVLFLGGTQRSMRAWKELSISRLAFDLVSFFSFFNDFVSLSLSLMILFYDSLCTTMKGVFWFLLAPLLRMLCFSCFGSLIYWENHCFLLDALLPLYEAITERKGSNQWGWLRVCSRLKGLR